MAATDFNNPLRGKLAAGETAIGIFVALEDATVTELAADLGVDWICVDMEHGHLDFRHALDHLRAARGSDLAVIIRVPTTTVDTVKRGLDIGAHGLVLPMISTEQEMRAAFDFARYPPVGKRGISLARANRYALKLQDYIDTADVETMVIPIIETDMASRNIEAILNIEGLEAMFIGPADLSMTRGFRGAWEGPGVAEDILRMRALAAEKNIVTAIMGRNEDDIAMRAAQGFRMLGIGSDISLLMKQLGEYTRRFKGTGGKQQW